MQISGGYFFQMSPDLKRKKTENLNRKPLTLTTRKNFVVAPRFRKQKPFRYRDFQGRWERLSWKMKKALYFPYHDTLIWTLCSGLDLDFLSKCSFSVFIYSIIIADKMKWHDDYSLHLCQFPLISDNINLLVSGVQKHIDTDTIHNYVDPFHLIVDRNQIFFFH